MVMLHPGQEATVGQGERLILQVSGTHASAVILGADATGVASIDRRQGSWVVEGNPGSVSRIYASSADGIPMKGRLAVALFVRGGPGGPAYELADVEVAGRLRVDLLDVARTEDGEWLARSRQVTVLDVPVVEQGHEGSAQSDGPAIHGDPVALDLAVAFDRSASMRWVFEGPSLSAVVTAAQLARRLALTPASSVSWYTYGSAADAADHPTQVTDIGLAPYELARKLHPGTYSSGARLSTVIPVLNAPDLLVTVTDFWPGADAVRQFSNRSPRLAVLILGVPHDPNAWPQEWLDLERNCSDAGVPTLWTVDAASAVPRIRNWFLSLFTDPAPVVTPIGSTA
jgi:hypothetical protein